MSQKNREDRLQLMLSVNELDAIDSFRYKHRMPSRAAAVRELLQLGLAATQNMSDGDGRKSSEFGIFGRGENSHSGPSEEHE